jgi:Nif-specific regulatory protein
LLQNKNIAFLCVPIRHKGKVVGALSVDVPSKRTSFEKELRLLEIISTIVAHALRAHQTSENEKERLVIENQQMKAEMRERFHVHNIIGNDKRMLEVYEQIHQVAGSDATVLLCGESGTGKELVANAIHYQSHRAQGPLVKINCAALPESLIESELFGHEKGAFTGAFETKKGRFELADGGTLFMDEISELSPHAQTKLLRAIQEREIERVGGKKPIRVNVRIIAASNRDLGQLVRNGGFRHDLFYRLNVFPIYLPALRERRSDIPMLVDHFIQKYAKRDHRLVRRIATAAIDMLMAYHWPGNVRELENCIERAVLLAKGGAIQAHHLPPTLQTAEASATGFKGSLKDAVSAYERDLIADALKSARGNVSKAARLLGSTARIVAYKAAIHKLDPEAFSTKM